MSIPVDGERKARVQCWARRHSVAIGFIPSHLLPRPDVGSLCYDVCAIELLKIEKQSLYDVGVLRGLVMHGYAL